MKSLLIVVASLTLFASTAFAGSIRVYNNDSRDHTVRLKCSGSSKSFTIRKSSTATYTFHSTNSSCDIVGGTVSWPSSKLKNGEKYKIKNGKAKRN